MADQNTVRRIAMALPGTVEEPGRFAFAVNAGGKRKEFAWVWLERIHPSNARVPQPSVLAVRVADAAEKAALLAADPDRFFTEPHYNGYPAVLVRLPRIAEPQLRQVIVEAWRSVAPRQLVAAHDAPDGEPAARPRSARSVRKSPRAPTRKRSTPRSG